MNNITNQNVKLQETLDRYESLTSSSPDFATLRSLLKQCRQLKSLRNGKRVHLQLRRLGVDRETLPGNLLVQMYGECGSLEDARSVFEQIARPDVYSWNILIKAYAQNGHMETARSLFQSMPRKNFVAWNGMMKSYAQAGRLDEAKNCFDQMPRKNVIAWTVMISAYAQYGHMSEARALFSQMPEKDCASWNAIITACAQNGYIDEALRGLAVMDQEGETLPNEITFLNVLSACNMPQMGKVIQSCVLECRFQTSVKVFNALISMYGRSNCTKLAKNIFEDMHEKDVITWTAMITAYAQNRENMCAVECFRRMIFEGFQPNQVTFLSALSACGELRKLQTGEMIHRCFEGAFKLNVVVGTALVNMYGKCHSIKNAERVFFKLHERNVQCWTAMVTAYAENGNLRQALQSFRLMDLDGETPNKVTSSITLDACSSHAAVENGRIIHSSLLHTDFLFDVMVATALLDLYGKSGHVKEATLIFTSMPCKNLLSWTTMVEAFARNGFSRHALETFHEMAVEGVQPDEISMISILSSCSHGGLVEDAVSYFMSLSSDFNVPVLMDHYLCMTDVLGRLGKLDQAEDLVAEMPSSTTDSGGAWKTLLGACHIHGDFERAYKFL